MNKREFEPGFRICRNKGFHITFENGWTISVQFGPGNYCGNRDLPFSRDYAEEVPHSSTAEIALIDPEGSFFAIDGDDVKGWVSPGDVLRFMNMIARKKVKSEVVS
jgi:hypothetical protein